jgi:hypothetical protein
MFDDDDDDHIFSLLSAAVEVFDTPVPNFRNRKISPGLFFHEECFLYLSFFSTSRR